MSAIPTSQQLGEWLADHKGELAAAGLAVISKDGHIEKATIGFYDAVEGEAVTSNTPFMLGSICKVLTATLVCQLVEEGKISLDDPIAKWLPETGQLYSKSRCTASIRQILGHSGGLVDLVEPVENLDDLVAKLVNQGLLAEPGEIVSYSNAGYMLLGALLKRVTGCDWETLVQSNVLDLLQSPVVNVVLDVSKRPSGGRLRDPLRAEDPPIAEDHIPGLNGTFTRQMMWPRWPGLFAATGTVTAASITDSVTLLGSLLWGDLLPPSSRREMQSVEYRLPGPSLWCEGWGLGWSVIDSSRGLVGHMGGTSTFMLGSVEMGKAVVFLSNTANGALVGRKLACRALGIDSARIPEVVTSSSSDLIPGSHLCGRYGTPAFFVEISVSIDDPGRVLAKSNLDSGDPTAIEKLSGSTFTGRLMSLPTEFTFVPNTEGTDFQYLHVGFRALVKILRS
ncbi:beta-lactamase/transpeptidase-like protein [Dactylonectria macrodidyma]|uniref:Beta-lactamase/transpeptidase-like protein n=1 Tax=Dactylonectria macrodidyma TaxID=307937 RepID=A0A9P9F510_9HYPO|nr:beta-lactamase/transpeptidase-like protein [Dactylonectria macrodidyma]